MADYDMDSKELEAAAAEAAFEERFAEMDFDAIVEIAVEEGYDEDGIPELVGDCANLLPDETACYGCESPVGFVFESSEDSYGRETEGLRFRETWIDPDLRLWCEDFVS